MKTSFPVSKNAGGVLRHLLVMTLLLSAQVLPSHAQGPVDPPLLEFAVGLAGKQVRLTWNSTPDTVYRIERSSTLAAGGMGGWKQVALVEATAAETSWVDPEATTTKNFYRITQPVAGVFSIVSPVLSTTGGELVIDGQGIPAGSFLVLEFDGQTLQVPLTSGGGGLWDAVVVGQFIEDSSVIARGIVDGSGTTLVSLNIPIMVTSTGRAADAPASLPPGAPVVQEQSNPIPGIGIVIKRNPGNIHPSMGRGKRPPPSLFAHNIMQRSSSGSRGPGRVSGGGSVGKATFKEFTVTKKTDTAMLGKWSLGASNPTSVGSSGMSAGKATFKEFTVTKKTDTASVSFRSSGSITGGGSVGKATFKEFTVTKRADSSLMSHSDHFTPQGINSASVSPLVAMWLSKKGYDYYKMQSDLSSAAMQNNPYFKNNGNQGEMVPMNRSLPGEVHVPVSALFLACPAGPNIDWVCTYRSVVPVSSGHGPGWDFSYNISIEPLPSAAGAAATRVAVRDGQGRRDVFHRQPDGSFRCDGIFREGRFDGEIFTLTFADTGKWIFKPLSDRLAPGKIAAIKDRNDVSLTCTYNGTGKLESVSSQFGQSLGVSYTGDRISGLIDQTGRTVSFSYYSPGISGGSPGDLRAISCPQDSGQPPAAGPVTFTYSTGEPDPRLNGNLLTATDGAGRLLGAFTYSSETDPRHISYDTCATAERYETGHVMINRREMLPPGVSPKGGYTIFENDEIGRVSETVCDRLHRSVSCKLYTGFSTPNVPVTSSSNRPAGKLRSTDPDFFETTCAFNADSLPTRYTHPDSSQEITTYDRDFRPGCPVREGGNPRAMTLRTPSGQTRTVSCDYLPGFGTLEPACHTVKSPRDSGSGLATGKIIGAGQIAGITGGAVAGIVVGCAVDGGITAMDDWESPVVRMVSAHGQVTTCDYDLKGNLTSVTSPIPGFGSLYQYNPLGQLTSATLLNGPGSTFTDTCNYDVATGFLASVIINNGGLNLTTTFVPDTLGRVIRVVDPRGNDGLLAYNALDQLVEIQSPPLPQRVVTRFRHDAAGSLARCDVDHRGADGLLVSSNPAYSSFLVYDDHGLLVRTAEEERPVDGSGVLTPDSLGIENFAACDITLNPAGECVRLSTPAACRGQATDLACDFTYDERGLLHRVHDGGTGNPEGLITDCDYDLFGDLTRCAVSGQGVVSETLASFDGFHRLSSETDPMGNVGIYEYDNRGYVTCSVYGEATDVPGSIGNVLLSKTSSKSGYSTRRRVEVLKSNRMQDPNSNPAVGGGVVPLEVARWSHVKNNNTLTVRTAFFGFETEDETITCDRFTPGGQITPEITVINRSPAGLVQQVSRNGDLLETGSYDTAGRLTNYVCGDTSHFRTLNPNGEVTSTTRTDTCPSDAAQTKTFTVSHVLDAAGRCVQTTDGIGNSSGFAYDSLDRPVSFTEPGGLVTRCAYDGSSALGPFSEEISADAVTLGTFVVLSSSLVRSDELRSTTDSYGHTTAFTADALGRLTRCDYPDGTFETRGHVHVNIGTIGHADHGRTTTTYDLNGRPLTSLTTSDPLLAPVSSTPLRTFTHDGLDRCTGVSQGGHVVACSYDSLGNLVSESQDGRVVSSTFNHRGRTRVSYPNGVALLENRDALGQLLTVNADATVTPRAPGGVTHQYLRAGRRVVRSVQGNGLVTTYQYRGDGEAALPGGADFSFDACVKVNVSDLSISIHRRDANQRDRRFELSFAPGSDAPLRSKTYLLDRLGRIRTCTDRSRSGFGAQIVITREVSYALDLEGRRLSATGGENPGVYEQLSTLPPGDQQKGQYSNWPRGPLEWDDNGNLVSMATATGTLSLVHDVEGRLTSVSRDGVPVISYDYDPLGRLISRAPETAPATTFVYDGDACVQELGSGGVPDLTHVFCDGIRQSVFSGDGTLYYTHGGINHWGDRADAINKVQTWGDPHENLNGRMNLLTTTGGAILERFDCDEAGKPVFLGADGQPTGMVRPIGPLRWMAPESIQRVWEPETGMLGGFGGVYHPDLGMMVSKEKPKPKPHIAGYDLAEGKK